MRRQAVYIVIGKDKVFKLCTGVRIHYAQVDFLLPSKLPLICRVHWVN